MEGTISRYFAALRGKRVLVLGLGVSNRPLARLLLRCGAEVVGCDRAPREKQEPETLELEALGMELRLGENYLTGLSGDLAFRTPGLHPDHPALQALRAGGTEVTSEMEIFFELCPCPILAVTGSDGKTTTTTLIAEFLKKTGRRIWLGGNIGAPLLAQAARMGAADLAVVELSSFQLLDMRRSPQTAVVTNLAPNHLDVHRDMAEYIAAKENIYRYQGPGDVAVFNADNEITARFSRKAKGHVLEFSRKTRPRRGVFLADDIIFRAGPEPEPIVARRDILLPGLHNIENYMAAICAVEGLVPDEDIRAVAASFPGVEHRIELVREKDGVRYYNDSIASSPSRTIAGLHSFPERVILIAGGYDKHIPYDVLGPEITAHVKALVLTGATAGQIRSAVLSAPDYREGAPVIVEEADFFDAIRAASRMAEPGDVVILSPASASFDRFKNFMERGAAFKKAVWEL